MSKKELNFLEQIKVLSLYGYCLSAGLSIAASQIFVCTNIVAFLLSQAISFSNPLKTQYSSDIKQIRSAGILWLLVASIASLVGMDISHSIVEIIKTFFYFIFPFSVMHSLERAKPENAILLLITSQTVAACHTLISVSFPELGLPNTPGAVTESGQLVLIIPIAFALFYLKSKNEKSSFLLTFCLALLFGALTVNLKRGPWMAIFFEFAFLGFLVSRRLLLFTIIGSVLLFLIGPARDRILALGDHFLIYGGRYNMWTLGLEILARYPLGLGLNNSSYMRVFEPSLPVTHRHMHNNFLNIAVETGVIGLAAYLWIFYSIYLLIKNSKEFRLEDNTLKLLPLCLGISIAGWQIAGLVEYNFGDSEIRLIALFLIGYLFKLSSKISTKSTSILSSSDSRSC